ncbi:hypothetical protein LIER_03700 [Lithospermum erythrorhizon]|uniref:CCHC-type domain-containing protein n=1 Tax=Lithospermum erythrorhizon TaxID=34254 RepID=A0AAV3NVD6_LITER
MAPPKSKQHFQNIKEPVNRFWREDGEPFMFPESLTIEVENTDSWTIQLLRESLQIDEEPESWILMTDQQKGLKTAIKNELPHAEHRLHQSASWRPKRCKRVDPSEAREKKEKEAAEKAKKARVEGIFKAPRHGAVIHCKICGSIGHNAKTCPRRPTVAASSQPATTSSSQPTTSTQPAPASSQPIAAAPRPAST